MQSRPQSSRPKRLTRTRLQTESPVVSRDVSENCGQPGPLYNALQLLSAAYGLQRCRRANLPGAHLTVLLRSNLADEVSATTIRVRFVDGALSEVQLAGDSEAEADVRLIGDLELAATYLTGAAAYGAMAELCAVQGDLFHLACLIGIIDRPDYSTVVDRPQQNV